MSPKGRERRALPGPDVGGVTSVPPRHRREPAKHEAILDAATRVFLRNGYSETSVVVIAAEAGVAKQTVYNHFGGKEELFKAVVQAVQDRAGARDIDLAGFEEWLARSEDLAADLRLYGRQAVHSVLREDMTGLRRLIIGEWERHPALLEELRRPQPAFELVLAPRSNARPGEERLTSPTSSWRLASSACCS